MGIIPIAWQGRFTEAPIVLLTCPVKFTMMGLTGEEEGESHSAMEEL